MSEALRKAVECIEDISETSLGFVNVRLDRMPLSKAKIVLRKALAEQPEQEPVAWHHKSQASECVSMSRPSAEPLDGEVVTPLYTTPPAPRKLTDDEIRSVYETHAFSSADTPEDVDILIAFARAIEQKLRGD